MGDKVYTVGEVLERFFGIEGAAKNPSFDYIPHKRYFQAIEERDRQIKRLTKALDECCTALEGSFPPLDEEAEFSEVSITDAWDIRCRVRKLLREEM
jgi:hypothetical protein